MVTEIQIRQDTTENWVATNPILADGEIGYDTTVMRFKVGNGVYKWTELSYTKNEMYDDTLVNEKINQINEDLSQKSNSSDVYTKQQIEDMLYITEDELYAKNYMEKNEALDKFVTKTESNQTLENYVSVERTINGKSLTENVELEASDVHALPEDTFIPSKVSDLENDKGYLVQVPSEYVTETELDSKGYLTQHQDISGKADITYVNTQLDLKANKSDIPVVPTKVSELDNDKGYLTQHQDISGKADKETTYTKEEVDSLIANVDVDVDLTPYLTKNEAGQTYALKTELKPYATTDYVNTELNKKITNGTVYTKDETDELLDLKASTSLTYTKTEVNELLDNKQDAGSYATKEELDTKQDKGDYALVEDVPTLVSQLDNDSGYATQLDVMQAIASIPQFKLQIVDSLSRDNAESMVLYLVPKGGSAPDVYDEYIWLEETGNYEFLGTTAVDLTGYVKNTDYASSKAAGLIRGYNANGFSFVPDTGYPYCESKSLASYNAAGGNLFIGKGTLEGIKYSYVRDGIAKNTYSLSDTEKEKVRNWIGAGVPTAFETMPDIYASAGKTYQYVGETTEEFTSGYFYKSVSQGISYIASDFNLTFDFDLFWSELASAGITLETLQMTEFDKERGGFSIIGTVESETNYRVQDINGIPLNVLLTQSIRSTSEYVGMSNRWYYKPAETFAWERVDVQPEQDLTEYVKNTDYATSSVGGVIKIANNYYYGLALNSSHQLYIVKAPDNQVIEKENMYRPIVPANLDLAVKTGVTTNTIELTDDEKTSAKQWLGYATQSDINTAIANLPQFKISIFDTLPETGETKVLYLVPKDSEAPDVYNEYIWIEDTSSFEFLGSTAVDLTDYVKNTDYATSNVGGVLKIASQYNTVISSSGYLTGSTIALDGYNTANVRAFISKGTLDNVLTQYSKTVLTTEADYEALETKDPNTLYLIEEE